MGQKYLNKAVKKKKLKQLSHSFSQSPNKILSPAVGSEALGVLRPLSHLISSLSIVSLTTSVPVTLAPWPFLVHICFQALPLLFLLSGILFHR